MRDYHGHEYNGRNPIRYKILIPISSIIRFFRRRNKREKKGNTLVNRDDVGKDKC